MTFYAIGGVLSTALGIFFYNSGLLGKRFLGCRGCFSCSTLVGHLDKLAVLYAALLYFQKKLFPRKQGIANTPRNKGTEKVHFCSLRCKFHGCTLKGTIMFHWGTNKYLLSKNDYGGCYCNYSNYY